MLVETEKPQPAPMLAEYSPVQFDRGSGRFYGTVKLINIDQEPIHGPLQIIFSLDQGVQLINAMGRCWGKPYMVVEPEEMLLPGHSVTVPVTFVRDGFWQFRPLRYHVSTFIEPSQQKPWQLPSPNGNSQARSAGSREKMPQAA